MRRATMASEKKERASGPFIPSPAPAHQPDAGTGPLVAPQLGHHFGAARIVAAPAMTGEARQLQAKLEISQPGDPCEQEADRVAEQVTRTADPSAGVPAEITKSALDLQRKCAACEEEDEKAEEIEPEDEKKKLNRKEAGTEPVEDPTSHVAAVTQSPGEPLGPEIRAYMEPRFGFDFSRVRIHTDGEAAESARSVRARAYTVGTHVVFGAGGYTPETSTGQRLLAHELTHVVQQTGRSAGEPAIHRAPDPAAAAAPPGTTSTDRSMTSSLGNIADDLQLDLKNKAGRREQILGNMLRAEKKSEELKQLYKEKSQNKDADLIADLKPGVGWSQGDSIRAMRYLTYGELRPADKIYLAAKGAGTDWPTIERMLPDVNKNFGTVEGDFSGDYKDDYPKKSRLPNGQDSFISGLIDDEFPSGNDAPEAIKGKAVIAFGEPQPLDLVRAGTDGDTLLRPLQQARQSFDSVEILQKRYQERYPESILQKHIESKLSGDDITRSRMILEGTYSARSRIKLAMGMGIDPDEKEIWAALRDATPAELQDLSREYKNQGDIYQMFKGGTFTGLSKENLLRAEAMLGAGPEGEDPVLTKLKAEGGVNGGEIVRVVRTALKNDWTAYRDAYNNGGGPLRKFADELLNSEEKGRIASYLQDKVLDRLKYGLDHQDVEYVTLQVTAFASDAEKKSILDDPSLTGSIASNFNARDANKIRDLLIPANLSPEERAKLLNDKIGRESSFFMGASANAEALEDEQRELRIALEKAKADGKLTPEEQSRVDALTKRTEGALAAYLGVRDELNGYLETALSIAASLAVSAATGGAGAGMLAAAVARAALAQAVASVAVKKIVHGDNFDVLSPEAVGVFAAGFVDGAMNAVGGPAAKTAISAALRDSARTAALETGNVVFASSGRTILTRVATGVLENSPGAMVGTAANDGTWKDGFAKGFGTVIQSGVEAGAVGAATHAVTGAVHDAKSPAAPDAAPSLDPATPKGDPKAPAVDPNAPKVDPNAKATDPNAPRTDANAPKPDPNVHGPSGTDAGGKVLPRASTGNGHEVVYSDRGPKRCSDEPCSLFPDFWKAEVERHPNLGKRMSDDIALGKTSPEAAVNGLASVDKALQNAEEMDLEQWIETLQSDTPKLTDMKQLPSKRADMRNKPLTEEELQKVQQNIKELKAQGKLRADYTYAPPDAAGFVLDPELVAKAKQVIGKTLADDVAVAKCWADAVEGAEGSIGKLTAENFADVYKSAAGRFWRLVEKDDGAKAFFAQFGFKVEGGISAALEVEGVARREISLGLDHMLPKASGDNWQYALTADKIQFLVQADNTKLSHLEKKDPSLRR